jgi:hypothetical protein
MDKKYLFFLLIGFITFLYLHKNSDCKERYKVDCKLSEYSTCVDGIQTRKIIQKPSKGGKPCGRLTQNCNIDCKLSEYSACDNNTGLQTRKIIQKPFNKGKPCGSLTQNCPVDCVINYDSGNKLIDGYTQYTGNITKQAMNNGKPCGDTIDNIGYISNDVLDKNNDCVIDYKGNFEIVDGNVVVDNGKYVSGNCKNKNTKDILLITKNKFPNLNCLKKDNLITDQANMSSCINGMLRINGVYTHSDNNMCPSQGTQESIYMPCSRFDDEYYKKTNYYDKNSIVSYYISENQVGRTIVYNNSFPFNVKNLKEAYINAPVGKKLKITGDIYNNKNEILGNMNINSTQTFTFYDKDNSFTGFIELTD